MHASTALGTLLVALAPIALPQGCELPEPPRQKNPVSWQTSTVSLSATDFWIDVDGERFEARVTPVEVRSDPGWNEYTSLEITWHERGREMRLYIYLSSNGTEWWSEQMRTYDGKVPAEWIYYYGDFFRRPVGQPFTGDFEVQNNGSADRYRGTLHFEALRLETRFRPQGRPGIP
jgi:hypothetical protein